MTTPIISVRDLCKAFPGVQALDHVSFELLPGEVHALLGENGAGKSTFVKMLTGAGSRDAGSIEVNGVATRFRSTAEAHAAGISIVFQEFSQATSLTVAENIYLGEWPTRGGIVDWRRMRRSATELLNQFQVRADPEAELRDLGVGTRQMVEILKGCRKQHIKALILDEPTSALSDPETETLFAFLKLLKERGVAIIYISHRLGEIQRICDRVTIFRNGKNVETKPVREIGVDRIVSLMVGRSLSDRYPPKPSARQQGGVTVKNLNNSKLRSISFEAGRGEILGLAGLIGAGKTELLRALFGADGCTCDRMTLDGSPIVIKRPSEAIKHKFAFLPENRKDQGLVMTADNRVNVSLAALRRLARPFLGLRSERRETYETMQQVDVRPLDPDQMVINLSGGNQQKIILARWLMAKSSVLLFDEPTRGIDVGAKYQIYSLMGDLARAGSCVIIASSDVEELVGVCNRVLVLAKGSIAAEYLGAELNEERLLRSCAEGSRN